MNKTALEIARKNAFLSLYGVSTQKEILELFRADCVEHKAIKNNDEAKEISGTRLFSKYALAITFLYNLSTIKTNLKAYKAVIRELGLEKVQSKFYFEGLSPTVNKTTKANVKKKSTVNKKMPYSVNDEIRRVALLLKNNSFKVAKNQTLEQVRSYHLIYILALATGRRFSELVKTVTITKRGEKFFFKGLLKKKDDLKNKEVEAHFLELGYKQIQAHFKELRKYFDTKLQAEKNISIQDITVQQINLYFEKTYNNAVGRITDKKVSNVHELRHFYTIAHQERHLSLNPHLKELNELDLDAVYKNVRYTVLGHEIATDSTATYITIK